MKHIHLCLFMMAFFLACAQNKIEKNSVDLKTPTTDSTKSRLQQQYYDMLARLDSAIGRYDNTQQDSLYIIGIKDSLLKMEIMLDSLSIDH